MGNAYDEIKQGVKKDAKKLWDAPGGPLVYGYMIGKHLEKTEDEKIAAALNRREYNRILDQQEAERLEARMKEDHERYLADMKKQKQYERTFISEKMFDLKVKNGWIIAIIISICFGGWPLLIIIPWWRMHGKDAYRADIIKHNKNALKFPHNKHLIKEMWT